MQSECSRLLCFVLFCSFQSLRCESENQAHTTHRLCLRLCALSFLFAVGGRGCGLTESEQTEIDSMLFHPHQPQNELSRDIYSANCALQVRKGGSLVVADSTLDLLYRLLHKLSHLLGSGLDMVLDRLPALFNLVAHFACALACLLGSIMAAILHTITKILDAVLGILGLVLGPLHSLLALVARGAGLVRYKGLCLVRGRAQSAGFALKVVNQPVAVVLKALNRLVMDTLKAVGVFVILVGQSAVRICHNQPIAQERKKMWVCELGKSFFRSCLVYFFLTEKYIHLHRKRTGVGESRASASKGDVDGSTDSVAQKRHV